MSRLSGGMGGVLAVSLLVAPALASGGRWIHVRVDEVGNRGARVEVQVPLTMVAALMPALKAKHLNVDGTLDFGRGDTSVAELRAYWAAVREAQDGEYVTIRDGSDRVRIAKRSGMVHLDVDGDERVKLRVPVPVVEAFLGTGDALDVDGLVRALGDAPSGELIAVDDDGSRVRIWIDDRPQPAREDAP